MELITSAQWAAGLRDTLWYPALHEMILLQAVVGVSAGTGLVLTAEKREGAERAVFQSYGIQALQVRKQPMGGAVCIPFWAMLSLA